MVADIFEYFDPTSIKFLSTPLETNKYVLSIYFKIFIF